jgi:hypothetical protein
MSLNGVVNITGPDVYSLDELGRLTLTAKSDGRCVVTDDTAGMFAAVHGDVLTARNAPVAASSWPVESKVTLSAGWPLPGKARSERSAPVRASHR